MSVHSTLASPAATIATLKRWGLHTDRSLGQHFLVDDGVIGRILRLAQLQAGDEVLEVGPGIGTLTEALLAGGARVCAVEKDSRLIPLLDDMQARFPKHFSYLCADAARGTFGQGRRKAHAGGARATDTRATRATDTRATGATDTGATGATDTAPAKTIPPTEDHSSASVLDAATSRFTGTFKLISNLPYAVAATIVLDAFQRLSGLQSATVMVQSEVAARMVAKPNTKDYGAYSVKLQLLAYPQGDFAVNPLSFLPPPRVCSTVIRLDRREEVCGQDAAGVLRSASLSADAAFAFRRKTIHNSMRSYFSACGLDPALVGTLLAAADISPRIRGEALRVEDYHVLGELLFRHLPDRFSAFAPAVYPQFGIS
ncbi:MAG: 16S rRNA (adenine(1518)-N(6)/adenine(1519)-N(6))-dimethyltransferase [Coriobacteriales bacterium]|nr:16S rRNA (adenine(1518)-N(6)/adenine(1519)-N(6))-dimethyltransferase [Coriobacteriales bacterium]